MSFRITDKDNGAVARIKEFMSARSRVKVGIFGDAGSYEDGASVLEIATFHEFGIGVPRRSFIADWVDENMAEIKAKEKALAVAYARGRLTLDQALEQLGLWAVGSIRERMSAGIPPPLEWREGTALIDTGTLWGSITHKIEAAA